MSSSSGQHQVVQRLYQPVNLNQQHNHDQHLIINSSDNSFTYQAGDGQPQQHINYQPNDQPSNAELMSMQQQQQYNKSQTQYQDPYYQELELSRRRQHQQKVSDGWNGSGQVEAQYHLQPSQHNRISSNDTLYQCSSASSFEYPGAVESSKTVNQDELGDSFNDAGQQGQQHLSSNFSLTGTQYLLTGQQVVSSDHKHSPNAVLSNHELQNYYNSNDQSNYHHHHHQQQQQYNGEGNANYVELTTNYCQQPANESNLNNYESQSAQHHHHHPHNDGQYQQDSYHCLDIQGQSCKSYKLNDDFNEHCFANSIEQSKVIGSNQAFQDYNIDLLRQPQQEQSIANVTSNSESSSQYSFTQVTLDSRLEPLHILADPDKSRQATLKGRRGRPRKKSLKSKNKVNGKLWEFIRDLLLNERTNPSFIRWERREDGVFKFVQSDKVAKMWGERKQNPKMTYEKLSRAMRYYYKSKVLLPVFGRRLVYKFGPNATGWLPDNDLIKQESESSRIRDGSNWAN